MYEHESDICSHFLLDSVRVFPRSLSSTMIDLLMNQTRFFRALFAFFGYVLNEIFQYEWNLAEYCGLWNGLQVMIWLCN